MRYIEVFLLLMTFVAVLGTLAKSFTLPYPILFVIGGLLISFIPNLPEIRLDPDLTFFLFLPPLLYIQAFYTSWRDFKREIRPISLLAIGLVLATTVTVGIVSHWIIPNFPLSAGFVLGAIISPPDAIAASAIAEHLHLPRRVITILEGESLVNDASGLVTFKIALAATFGVAYTFGEAVWEVFSISIGGIVVGLAIGFILSKLRRFTVADNPRLLITFSVLTPFASYLAAENLHVSGVLSAVATGLYLGWKAPEEVTAEARLQGAAFWDLLAYWLNGIIFVMIGLQLPVILRGLHDNSWLTLLTYASVICATCVIVRLIWVFPGAYLPRFLNRSLREADPYPDWRHVLVIGWCGMRGVVSLAAAISLSGWEDFPHRELVQFLSFSVILFTLLVQGMSLPVLIKYLGIGKDSSGEEEEKQARRHVTRIALDVLAAARKENRYPELILAKVDGFYQSRLRNLEDTLNDQIGWSEQRHQTISHLQLRRLLIVSERRALLDLRKQGVIGDDVMHKIERELDIQEAQLR